MTNLVAKDFYRRSVGGIIIHACFTFWLGTLWHVSYVALLAGKPKTSKVCWHFTQNSELQLCLAWDHIRYAWAPALTSQFKPEPICCLEIPCFNVASALQHLYLEIMLLPSAPLLPENFILSKTQEHLSALMLNVGCIQIDSNELWVCWIS